MTFLKTALYFFLIFVSTACFAKQYSLSMCSMFQNEAPYIKEWVEFHRLVGVEHFWLYNNNSTDNYKEVLKPYVKKGIVTLVEWPSNVNTTNIDHHTFIVQVGAFTDAIKRAKKNTKWLAILDVDEFLFSPINDSVVEVLDKYYKECSGVCVNWQLFGTSHVASIGTKELLLEKLQLKAPTDYARNRMFKSIIRPGDVRKCTNPHFCRYKAGKFNVNANRERIETQNTGVFVDKLRVNHYWVRDEHFLQHIKIPRYQNWTGNGRAILEEAGRLNAVYDGVILRFVPKLREAMFGGKKKK